MEDVYVAKAYTCILLIMGRSKIKVAYMIIKIVWISIYHIIVAHSDTQGNKQNFSIEELFLCTFKLDERNLDKTLHIEINFLMLQNLLL